MARTVDAWLVRDTSAHPDGAVSVAADPPPSRLAVSATISWSPATAVAGAGMVSWRVDVYAAGAAPPRLTIAAPAGAAAASASPTVTQNVKSPSGYRCFHCRIWPSLPWTERPVGP